MKEKENNRKDEELIKIKWVCLIERKREDEKISLREFKQNSLKLSNRLQCPLVCKE